MFGIDFSELVVCIIVALFVIGPQRLPETVRTLGLWIGRLKRSLRETRETIEQQLGVEEIRRQLHTEEMMRTLDSMQDEIETALNYERRGNKPAIEQENLGQATQPQQQVQSLSDVRSLQETRLLEETQPSKETQQITETQISIEAQVFVNTQLSQSETRSSRLIEDIALVNANHIKTGPV